MANLGRNDMLFKLRLARARQARSRGRYAVPDLSQRVNFSAGAAVHTMRLVADGLKRMMYEHSSITTDEEHIVMRKVADEVSKVMASLDGLSQRSFPPFVETARADPT